ncbi:MAG: hypothetical protein EHM91_13410, partial [Planctomycetota bacterium]
MIRMEPNVVLKYFDPVDSFVKIRHFTADEVSHLLKTARISDRRSYVGLIVNACVLGLTEKHLEYTEDLYQLCIEVNPPLEIHRVAIEGVEPSSQIHLLDHSPAPRDFKTLHDMEAMLGRTVVGQEKAIASVSRAVKKAMTGL